VGTIVFSETCALADYKGVGADAAAAVRQNVHHGGWEGMEGLSKLRSSCEPGSATEPGGRNAAAQLARHHCLRSLSTPANAAPSSWFRLTAQQCDGSLINRHSDWHFFNKTGPPQAVTARDARERCRVTTAVLGAAIEVHRTLGPGLLESVYGSCLAHELELRGVAFRRQLNLPTTYKGIDVGCHFRVDFVVEGSVVVELKSVEIVLGIHWAQLLTYLKLLGLSRGLLLNFNVPRLKDGIESLLL
jgi:GxxExxY protein